MRKLFVILAAVAFVFAFTAPAKADVSIGGYVGFNTYFKDVDKEQLTTGYDDSDTSWLMDEGCSRLTFNFKEGPFGAIVEIRPYGAVTLRHFWATWNFGAGTLGIGQFWTADFSGISSGKYNCGFAGAAGDPGNSLRENQIQLQFGNLKIGLLKPHTSNIDGALNPGHPGTDFDTSMPKIVASYNLNVAMLGLKFYGGYQSYDVVNAADVGYSVDSTIYGLTASAGFGPLTIKGQIEGATNINEYTLYHPKGFNAYWDGTKILDADFMTYGLDFQWKASDAWTVTAGYTSGKSELDRTGTWEDETSAYHVNATWRVAKNVYITPEYFVIDYSDVSDSATTKAEEGKETYYGVYWRIKF